MAETDEALAALARELGGALRKAGVKVATAESCTGGWLAKSITDVAGSSAWFGWGVVSYSNAAKASLLGVPETLLAAHGAVSEPVVKAMAEAARRSGGADLGVGISGIAGPDGATPGKPVGTVWVAWASGDGTRAEHRLFAGDRDAVRRQSVALALCGLLAELDRRPA
ncbi:MAG TPA: nicotinamide-nucleotide amidohydrolase family protein [Gammaproteobacteria bacterium]|jgi:nicotinamide-nucleotide amidase